MTAQLIENLSNENYHARSEFSSSQLKDLVGGKTPAHFYNNHILNKKEFKESQEMKLGTLVHTLLLEPQNFESEYAVEISHFSDGEKLDGRKTRTKEWRKKFDIESAGKTVISEDLLDNAKQMTESLQKHQVSKLLELPNCIAEASIIYQDVQTGLNLRVRPDFHIPPCEQFPNGLIVDLKTTGEANNSSFSKTIYNFGYHISAVMYGDGFMQYYNTPIRPDYVLLVVEREAPYAVIAYKMGEHTMMKGEDDLRRALVTLSNCQATGQYPAYPSDLQDIDIPSWALKVA